MKTCMICGEKPADSAETCPGCGEASFVESSEAPIATLDAPEVETTEQPVPSRRDRRR